MGKAGRPKKDSAGLPGWFDIEKYRCAKDFKTIDWYQQLAFRHVVMSWLHTGDLRNSLDNAWLLLIQKNPIVTEARLEEAYPILDVSYFEGEEIIHRDTAGDFMLESLSLDHDPAHGVRAVTNGDIYRAYNGLPRKMIERRKDGADADTDEKLIADLQAEAERLSLFRSPYVGDHWFRNDDHQFVKIDTSLPTSLLQSAFAGYLKSQKRDVRKASGPFFKNPDLISWHNSGVLPYLDLELWATATGEAFHWPAFADALNGIVDKPVSSEDAIRKTVKSHVKKLMKYQTIRILKTQATKEQSNQQNKSGKLIVR